MGSFGLLQQLRIGKVVDFFQVAMEVFGTSGFVALHLGATYTSALEGYLANDKAGVSGVVKMVPDPASLLGIGAGLRLIVTVGIGVIHINDIGGFCSRSG